MINTQKLTADEIADARDLALAQIYLQQDVHARKEGVTFMSNTTNDLSFIGKLLEDICKGRKDPMTIHIGIFANELVRTLSLVGGHMPDKYVLVAEDNEGIQTTFNVLDDDFEGLAKRLQHVYAFYWAKIPDSKE